jgi:hypothetical protein
MTVLHKIKRSWFAWRDWRDRRALTTERVGASRITWNPRHLIYVRAYYRYCVTLFRDALLTRTESLHLVFGDYPAGAGASGTARRIGFQIEHTLVKPGGGDSDGAPSSQTALLHAPGHYLARVLHLDALLRCDRVIEYSQANIAHLTAAGGFETYLARVTGIAPLLFAPDFGASGRSNALMTMFSDPGAGRRRQFLDHARAAGLPIRNRKRCFDTDSLRQALRHCRILVNVRRSDHHDTLEELRVLPALLCGVVVISEAVPRQQDIPYARFIIWSHYDDLVATVASVHADYAHWHARIFSDPELPAVLQAMQRANRMAVDTALDRMAAPGRSALITSA